MRKVQIMQQFHFDILAKTGWKAVNINDGPARPVEREQPKEEKKREKKTEGKNF